MNITKLTFLLRRKLRNSLIFRNFTILSAAIILFPSGVFAQEGNVSIHIKNGTVKTFMKQVEQQTRYTFVYRNHVLNDQTKVTISCTKKPISEALSQVFTPLNISYSFTNNTIVLVKQETEQRSNEKRAIKGTVLDESGIPIIGANVMQGKGTGVITDINGNFTILTNH